MIPAGVHLDLPEDDYYSDSALSCSMAKVLARPGGPAKLQQRIAQAAADMIVRSRRGGHDAVR